MSVTFEWNLPTGTSVPEDQLEQNADQLRELQQKKRWEEGAVILAGKGKNQRLRIADVLGYLVLNLCYQSIPRLLAGAASEFKLFTKNETVRLEPDGDEVLVKLDSGQEQKFPRGKLLADLVDCGERYNKALRRIFKDNPRWLEYVGELDEMAAQTRAYLNGAPLPPLEPESSEEVETT